VLLWLLSKAVPIKVSAEKIGIFIRDPSMELVEYKNIKYDIKLI